MVTMLLGGLWHGAGWNFVIWGGLHGLYLVINHGWQSLRTAAKPAGRAVHAGSIALTFLVVTLAWVFFRSADLPSATRLLSGLVGSNGFGLPESLVNRVPILRPTVEALGITTFLGGTSRFVLNWAWVLAAGIIAFACPNSQQLLRRYRPAFQAIERRTAPRLVWRVTAGWAATMGALLALCLLSLARPTEFLYFQF